jgi:hypothetical protein
MEQARTERANDQTEDKGPAARTSNRSNRKVRKENAAAAVPARVKAGVAAADKVVARDKVAVAVKTVDAETGHVLPKTQTRRIVSCQD